MAAVSVLAASMAACEDDGTAARERWYIDAGVCDRLDIPTIVSEIDPHQKVQVSTSPPVDGRGVATSAHLTCRVQLDGPDTIFNQEPSFTLEVGTFSLGSDSAEESYEARSGSRFEMLPFHYDVSVDHEASEGWWDEGSYTLATWTESFGRPDDPGPHEAAGMVMNHTITDTNLFANVSVDDSRYPTRGAGDRVERNQAIAKALLEALPDALVWDEETDGATEES